MGEQIQEQQKQEQQKQEHQKQERQKQEHHNKPWHKKQRVKLFAAVLIAVILVGFASWWVLFRSFVSTNDSRVAMNIIRVSPVGVGGTIEKVMVEEGDVVKEGQVMVEIDHRVAEANFKKAKAKFEQASAELNRLKRLYGKNYTSKRDFDNAKMNFDIAEAELRLTEVNLQNTYLKSPINGIVIQKLAFPGNLLEPGQVAAAIADVDHAWVSANIEETRISQVKPGQDVAINIDEGGKLTGKVQEITSATASQFSLLPSENASGNFTKVVQKIPIKIALDPHPDIAVLRAGQSVSIKIKVR
jgi:membrane fusion protein, multidrug efflux system